MEEDEEEEVKDETGMKRKRMKKGKRRKINDYDEKLRIEKERCLSVSFFYTFFFSSA